MVAATRRNVVGRVVVIDVEFVHEDGGKDGLGPRSGSKEGSSTTDAGQAEPRKVGRFLFQWRGCAPERPRFCDP
jgi:hypothetical protein